MGLAPRIEQFLNQLDLSYVVVEHPRTRTLGAAAEAAGADPGALARGVLLEGDDVLVLAVLPATHMIDFNALRARFGTDLEPVPATRLGELFPDCEPGCVPPVSEPYGLHALVDESVANIETLYFEPGGRDCLVSMPGADFQLLHATSWHGRFARPPAAVASEERYEFVLPEEFKRSHDLDDLHPTMDARERVKKLEKLPAMPTMAAKLLRLRNSPAATVADLSAIVAADPSLAAQLVRYARSAFFGYRGKVSSLEDAISRVLGFETVMNMALGLATTRGFTNPTDGPLGLHAFWRHSTYNAALCQSLTPLLPARLGVRAGTAYLTGLLHDFGFLLAGHLFPSEFYVVNKAVAMNPKVPVTLIEKRVWGVQHTQLGSWLMGAWQMPPEVIITVREHHNETYAGPHQAYAHLALVADHLLAAWEHNDAAGGKPPGQIMTALGLDPKRAQAVVERLMESADDLNALARQLCA